MNQEENQEIKRYEGFSYGPFQVERIGRLIRTSFNLDKEEFDTYTEFVRSKREEIREELNKKIQALMDLIKENNPLELLSPITFKNCFGDPTTYSESIHEGKEYYAEYALSLVLAVQDMPDRKSPSNESLNQFETLIHEIYQDTIWYYFGEASEKKLSKFEYEIRFLSILQYLTHRGFSYVEHEAELIRDLFAPHEQFLKKQLSLGINKIISAIFNIKTQIELKFKDWVEYTKILKQLHERYKDFYETRIVKSSDMTIDWIEEYHSLPEVKEKTKDLTRLRNEIDKNPFLIEVNESVPKSLLLRLSSQLGENTDFFNFTKFTNRLRS